MKKVLVTGASGFIGQAAVPLLVKNKFSVTALTRGKERLFGSSVRYVRADLSRAVPPFALKNINAVVHLAGEININASIEDPRANIEHNLAMTFNVLEAVRKSGNKPLAIFISTDRVYGHTKRRAVDEEERPFPIEPYAASKMLSETLFELYAHLYGIPYIVLRFDSVYGPHQPREMFISDLIQKMHKDALVKTGSLAVRKNFVYVADAADAIVRSLRAPVSAHNTVYNIGGKSYALSQVAAEIAREMSKRAGKKIFVRANALPGRPARIEVRPFNLSTKKAFHMLHWRAKTPLTEGLRHTIDYFLQP
ncbi:MAG: NAD(P)-dependent oxidoreductase [Patescibacteria group bacterium]|nr:NAD(P)-dependent oxidoreductase [Patescibacteria group bacterium]